MRKFLGAWVLCVWSVMGVTGCSSDLKAPCANYGLWCQKAPINEWDKTRS